ncbi:MAG TPA: hypothetical protein PLD25_14475 [Chloroflexota bacterium]|nr:hypothetical protein [Chloroflexota bacterium]
MATKKAVSESLQSPYSPPLGPAFQTVPHLPAGHLCPGNARHSPHRPRPAVLAAGQTCGGYPSAGSGQVCTAVCWQTEVWYLHDNPVRKGLEWEATAWLFSSAAYWLLVPPGETDVILMEVVW